MTMSRPESTPESRTVKLGFGPLGMLYFTVTIMPRTKVWKSVMLALDWIEHNDFSGAIFSQVLAAQSAGVSSVKIGRETGPVVYIEYKRGGRTWETLPDLVEALRVMGSGPNGYAIETAEETETGYEQIKLWWD